MHCKKDGDNSNAMHVESYRLSKRCHDPLTLVAAAMLLLVSFPNKVTLVCIVAGPVRFPTWQGGAVSRQPHIIDSRFQESVNSSYNIKYIDVI
eukprot:4996279-Amphidinium_carterae.1